MNSVTDALAEAIERAEKSLNNQGDALENRKRAGYEITKLSDERARRRAEEALQLVTQARKMGLDEDTLEKITRTAQAHATASEHWMFVMLSPAQNAEVIEWLQANSKRPAKAVMVWARLLVHLRIDNGEIMISRQDLADRVGISPQDLSKIITELVSINAVRREKIGRGVKYFLNPTIATHIPNPTQRAKERDAAGPIFSVMDGGRP